MRNFLLNANRKAAENGFAKAQHWLGVRYFIGDRVIQDYSQAVFWLQKAAEQGLAVAQYDLGICYYNGKGGFIKKMFITTLPLGLATLAILLVSILFRRGYNGKFSGFWFILILIIVYTFYVSTGFFHGIGMLILNAIVAFPAVFFIFAVESSETYDSYD